MASSKKRILVFPCGSEISLEIHRSLKYSAHFSLIGASSIEDHGHYVYEEYIGGLPFHNSSEFQDAIHKVVLEKKIDAIYPAMDAVAETLKNIEEKLGCIVIGSNSKASSICASKSATYALLDQKIPTPEVFNSTDSAKYPAFIKPDRGYGSRNTAKVSDKSSAEDFLKNSKDKNLLLQEFLPGKEWTVDCFSDRHGSLLFSGARGRDRLSNGISVRTSPTAEHRSLFEDWAKFINKTLNPRGAWFFQARESSNGSPKLLEVAVRPAGSSGIFRCKGINFAMLSVFDAFNHDVTIHENQYGIELDRALESLYKIDISYNNIYIDLDDCIIINKKINTNIIKFIHQCINKNKKIYLITRHKTAPFETLKKYRISELFDEVIHITNNRSKSSYIVKNNSIFIDDSYAERKEVASTLNIPVFSPDMVEALL